MFTDTDNTRKYHQMKRQKQIGKSPYQWTIHSDAQLKFWPPDNELKYLNFSEESRFVDGLNWDCDKKSMYPPKLKGENVWTRHDVLSVGFARHTKGYYHSRDNCGFIDAIIVVNGVLGARFGKETHQLNRGDMIVIPPDNMCDTFVNGVNTSVYWLHMKASPFWTSLVGGKISVKKTASGEAIAALFLAYEVELFSPNRSETVLRHVAEALIETLRREFSAEKLKADFIKKLVADMESSPSKPWRIAEEAGKIGISPRALDREFRRIFSLSFSKFAVSCKMKKAAELLGKRNMSNAEIAEKLGYANAYSFSKAFKSHYGKSPKFVKNA